HGLARRRARGAGPPLHARGAPREAPVRREGAEDRERRSAGARRRGLPARAPRRALVPAPRRRRRDGGRALAVIHLEIPGKLRPLVELARSVAAGYFRPISRKYDRAEHTYPKELDLLAAAFAGMEEAG